MRSRHGVLLAQRLQTRRQDLLESMARGLGPEAYQQTVGQVRGIEEALLLSDEADDELNKG